MSEKCKARIYGDWVRSHQCNNRAKKDGFCMMHHPDTKAAKERAWKEEFERKRARDPLVVAHASISALKRQRDELLEALEVLIQPYHGLNDKTLSASVSKARAAIAKAKGESA